VRITSKGQVTIPQAIREQAGFLPNTEVEFIVDGDLVMLVKAKESRQPTRGELVVRHLRAHPARTGLSTDEIMALMRGEA
jgi:AbrB family looped-hinge helix DNA binding protein